MPSVVRLEGVWHAGFEYRSSFCTAARLAVSLLGSRGFVVKVSSVGGEVTIEVTLKFNRLVAVKVRGCHEQL